MKPFGLLMLPFVAALAFMSGCAHPPGPGEPVRPAELAELAETLNAAGPSGTNFRGSGSGEIRASGRTLDVSFAVIYERPRWLRADLRPALGTMGANLTALALMEGECARLYFPARLVEVSGCLSDVAGQTDWIDPPSLLLGLADASFLTRLTDVTLFRSGSRLRLSGRHDETSVVVEVEERGPFISSIELLRHDADEGVRVSYEGQGWKEGTLVPREVELVALENTSREITVRLRYEKLRRGEPVDRRSYALEVPPGVLEIDWRDLSIWR